MKAVIMAGGEGARLRPLTCDRPKPMVSIMNKPMMEHIIVLLKKHNFEDVAVTLQYMPEAIKDFFLDGISWGVNLNYFVEETPLGTAGSVKNASSFLDQTFLVISGDALTDIDLTEAVKFHREKGSMATLVLTSVETPLEYGVVITEEDGRISQFLEKPSWGEVFSDTVNTGIYILEPEVLDYFEPGVKFDFSKDLFPKLLENKDPLYGYVAPGYWCDVGNLQQYLQAHFDVLQGKVDLEIEGTELKSGVWVGAGAKVSPEADLVPPVVIGENCRINPGAEVKEYSVIGPGTIIEKGTSVKRSVCWQNSYLGKNSALRGAVICNQVKLKERVHVLEGAVIGEGSILENDSQIKPGVKVWPDKNVESGMTLQNSLIWGRGVSKNLFGSEGIRGQVNMEITPELTAVIGNIFGVLSGEGALITLSSDDWKASRALKHAAASGLMASGAEVLDLGDLLTPAARLAVKDQKAKGGVHIFRSPKRQEEVSICLFDDLGLNIPKGLEKKIEQAYHSRDYKRIPGNDNGQRMDIADFDVKYRKNVLENVDQEVIKRNALKVLLVHPKPLIYSFVSSLLHELGVEATVYQPVNKGDEPYDLSRLREDRVILMELMKKSRLDLAVFMDRSGENISLMDIQGRLISGDYFTALMSYMLFKAGDGGTVAVPVTASGVIEKIAQDFNGKVVRTKTSPRYFMEQLHERNLHLQFALQYNAPAALVKILEFMSQEGFSFPQLLSQLPDFHLSHKKTRCPWGVKGKVMRQLIEENRGKDVELIDGVKIQHPEGWVLVLPDPEEPLYQIYGEGSSEEKSDSLTETYVEKIQEMQREST